MKDIEVRLQKKGPNGIPSAEVLLPKELPLEKLAELQKVIVRDFRDRLGLGACPACRSGLDLNIRRRFDDVITKRLDAKTFQVLD